MRFIGIQHRVKISADEELRPTRVAIIEGGKLTQIELQDEQAELDFVLGYFPTTWRTVLPDDQVANFKPHHIKWRAAEKDENETDFPGGHVGPTKKSFEIMQYVAATYDGLRTNDTVGMVLGGSGDYLASALARQAQKVDARVLRIPSFLLKRERDAQSAPPVRFGESEAKPKKRGRKKEKTEDDDILLATLALEKPRLFYPLMAPDQQLILVRECWRALWEAMQARMACEKRLRQYFIGRLFTSADGLFPEGGIEKAFDAAKASDTILNALQEEEKRREKELTKILKEFPLYEQVFKPIEGLGIKIGARLIAAIVDIRRFETDAQLKAFCGVHVLPDGRFPRQRTGEVANWHGDARQALVLFAEQANRRSESDWGKYLRQMKANLRAKHPLPIKVEVPDKENGGTKLVMRYSDGHIQSMAEWRTATRFVEWLHKRWWRFERGEALEQPVREAA
jgi:transposase